VTANGEQIGNQLRLVDEGVRGIQEFHRSGSLPPYGVAGEVLSASVAGCKPADAGAA
jgi:hypothetical protein